MLETIKAVAKARPVVHRPYVVKKMLRCPIGTGWYLEKTDTLTAPVEEFQQISRTEFAVLTEDSLLFIVDVQES